MSQEPVEPDVVAIIKGMQQQLTSIEKKIDILMRQAPAGQPRDKFYPRPSRPFEHYKKKVYDGPREESHGGENRGFGGKKKPFYYRGKGRG